MKLDGYIRVSQVKGRAGESFLSPGQQRERIESWAKVQGHQIYWHKPELDQSGGKMKRPIFDAVLKRVESGATQGVVVAKVDRFARSLVGALTALQRLTEAQATFVSVAESFDTSTPAGRLMLNVLLAFAEFELDRIKENWADALSNAIEVRGIQPTVPPFGYRKDDGKRFVVDPIEAPCVKEIFRRHIAGEKWASIARWLNAESIKPRQSEQWTGETVKQLTRREVYLGVVSKGDLRKDGAHEPLVNKTDFITCRDSFAKSGDAPSETRHVLNGIVRCAGCSRLMSGRGYKQAGQPRVAQYQCQVHHTAGDCPAPANVNETRILPYIETELFTHVGDVAAESQVESVELTQALEDEASAREVLTSYRDDVSLQDILGMQSFKEGLRIRQRALQSATEALAQARQTTSGIDLPPIETLTNVWPDLRPAERQRLFASAIDVIYVRRGAKRIEDRVKILWRGENVEPLSGPGRSVPLRTMSW